jgi:hypothetical protein
VQAGFSLLDQNLGASPQQEETGQGQTAKVLEAVEGEVEGGPDEANDEA